MRLLCGIALCASASFAGTAHAQTRNDDPAPRGRMHIGPVGVVPSIALTNLGLDKNVFNASDNPREDYTATLSPSVSWRLKAGPTRLTVDTGADLAYYQRYASERSIDHAFSGRYELLAGRFKPGVAGLSTRARQRSGYEIDVRAQRDVRQSEAGIDVALRPKTRLTVSGQRADYTFAHEAYLESGLDAVLNRRQESAKIEFFHDLTPLTTVVVDGDARRDRFVFAPDRDADSVRVGAGLDLKPFALISGRLRIGVRKFNALRPTLTDYQGLVGAASLATTIRGRLHVTAILDRDVEYSYLIEQPYYLLTGARVELTQQLTRIVDVQVRGDAHDIAYRGASAGNAARDRVDYVQGVGGGVGFRAGDVRVSVNGEQTLRASSGPFRNYQTTRFWTAVTYGR